MFDGLPQEEQLLLHQFITRPTSSNSSSSTSSSLIPLLSLPLPLSSSSSSSFPSLLHSHPHPHHHHHQTNTNFNTIPPNPPSSFDTSTAYSHLHHHHHHHQLLVPEFLNHPILLHHSNNTNKSIATTTSANNNNGIDSNHHHHHHHQHKEVAEIGIGIDDAGPWTNDEVLSLLRIRSTMENWFPDFTWEHVSRKLAELGFKTRSAEKCKEKFEEESNYFNNNISNTNNNSQNCTKNFKPLFLSELEELYNHSTTSHHHQNHDDHTSLGPTNNNNNNNNNPIELEEKRVVLEDQTSLDPIKAVKDNIFGEDSTIKAFVNNDIATAVGKKRKRGDVLLSSSAMTTTSQKSRSGDKLEMLKGFCEEIVSKMMAQQEEMHNKLLEDMVKRDQEKVRKEEEWKRAEMDRINRELDTMAREQAIAGDRQATIIEFLRKFSDPKKPTTVTKKVSPSNTSDIQNPNPNPKSRPFAVVVEDLGKRWPRDEVLALINLRCSLYNDHSNNNNNNLQDQHNDGPTNSNKAIPLWEKISQGMWEMGFKRSAKRCKEKWENINKYFRKTKDANKKRSLDSRTCPYFHQLTTLYNQGKVVGGGDNVSMCSDQQHHSSSDQGHINHDDDDHHHQGERSETTTIITTNNDNNHNVVPPAFDFEF